MWKDPILEELYAIRKELAAQFNYDVRALGEYCKAQQQLDNRPVVSRSPRYCKPTPSSNVPVLEAEKVA
jgi:hypothetical protein